MRFLSEEWIEYRLERSAEFILAERADLRVQHVVHDCPDGRVIHYYDELAEGRLVRSGLGDIEDPAFCLHRTCDDEMNILRGDMDPYIAVVDGAVRVEGDVAHLLSFLPLLAHHQKELDEIFASLVEVVDSP
ncbi:MAG: hypothetical protein ACLQDY_27280 [Streptosporangiaceae bacterium]